MAASTSKCGSLSKLEDFMALGLNNLVDFLAVRGLKTSGRKVEKKLRSKEKDDETSKEETRRKELHKFNPIPPAYQKITDESISCLYQNLQQVSPESVVFCCIPVDILKDEDDKLSLHKIAKSICEEFNDDDEKVSKFLESLPTNTDIASKLEVKTRGQSVNELWKEARIGWLTASNHHEIYTKVNSVAKSSSIVKPKTTPLVKKILFHDGNIDNLDPIKWGRLHEEVGLKRFYVQEAMKQQKV
ncbi:hypothetical protein LOTGIDRAFT_163266 [Paramuricea clavata]|uniref:Uncharacterized protein n=1 Tax=Paramuricea clavata TaxID=317549 RepID=A0A7D9DRA6_PARCT|nr:hypothetical protein LOTGIDRAFT_163266 [Paramuricea clavata]